MLVPSRRSRLLLLHPLLLLLLALSARSVRGQNVTLSKVSNDHVEAAWDKTGVWAWVENFIVTLNATNIFCTKVQECTASYCTFNSGTCGSLEACSYGDLTISGNETPSALTFQTAPEPVTSLNVLWDVGTMYINWTNPAIESSTCYNYTTAEVSNTQATLSSTDHPEAEEGVAVPMWCEFDDVTVRVWTTGGDGGSEEREINYKYPGPVPVTHLSCQPEGCYGIDLTWDYNPVCPNVTHFCVRMDGTEADCTEDTATTSLLVTGLEADGFYSFDISAYGKDGLIWVPVYQSCSTFDTAVRNLVAVSTSPDSLSATWESPECLSEKSLEYGVSINTSDCSPHPQDTTTNTSYAWAGLEHFTKYYVCVAAKGKQQGKNSVYTQPRRVAWLRLGAAGDDAVLVEWENVTDYEDTPRYLVTWDSQVHQTDDIKYTIKGYSSTEELGRVCVAVCMQPYGWSNVTGPTRCGDVPISRKPNVLLIVLLSVGIPAVIVTVVGIVVIYRKRQKKAAEPSSTS